MMKDKAKTYVEDKKDSPESLKEVSLYLTILKDKLDPESVFFQSEQDPNTLELIIEGQKYKDFPIDNLIFASEESPKSIGQLKETLIKKTNKEKSILYLTFGEQLIG